MADRELEAIRQQVMTWVAGAGAIARERLGRAAIAQKADDSVVTDADHAAQEYLLERIGRVFPEDAAITEEAQPAPYRHASAATAARCWVIDPIDGTRNYARGFPLFTVSVALMSAGAPAVGVIHNPMTGEMYSASAGCGAWMNDRRLAVRDEPKSGGSLIAVPSARRGPLPRFLHRWMDEMVLRNTGSTALHLAMVASGAVDAAYSDDCHLWDMAAGAIIAAEAGAVVVRPDGRPHFPMDLAACGDGDVPFLAAGPTLARVLLAECAGATQ